MPESQQFKRPESVLVAIHSRCGQVLMLRRVAPSRFWQSVTGSLEGGETPCEAAVREIAEETGLTVAAAQLHDWQLHNRFAIPPKWSARYAPGTTMNTEHAFSLCLDTPCPVAPDPAEHEAARWVSHTEAMRLAWSWTNRDLLRLIAATPSA
jgi:dATP pyrophosphohydrolase